MTLKKSATIRLCFFLDEVSYQGNFLDQLSYSTKCLLDEMSVRRNGLSTKWVSTKCRAPGFDRLFFIIIISFKG